MSEDNTVQFPAAQQPDTLRELHKQFASVANHAIQLTVLLQQRAAEAAGPESDAAQFLNSTTAYARRHIRQYMHEVRDSFEALSEVEVKNG